MPDSQCHLQFAVWSAAVSPLRGSLLKRAHPSCFLYTTIPALALGDVKTLRRRSNTGPITVLAFCHIYFSVPHTILLLDKEMHVPSSPQSLSPN